MIPYVRDLAFEYGRSDRVSPLIRRVIANNPGPFTYLGTGTYIVGHGEVAVVDPGPALDDHLDAILQATRGETVTHILITHHHADHSPLARPLAAKTGAVIYGCAVAAKPVEEEVKLEAGYDDFTPDIAVCGGATIAGAGLDRGGHPHAGAHLQPHLLRVEGGKRAFQRRSHHGLVHHRDHAAGRRYGRLSGQPGINKSP